MGWPAGITCLARRTRIRAGQVSRDPRARKRRTIPKDQLTPALDGKLDHVYGYSLILTNRPVHDPADPAGAVDPELLAESQYWHRHSTDIEALNKGRRPVAPHALQRPTVNRVWMWAALLACAICAWIQDLTGIGHGNGRGPRTLTRLRRKLINIPARVTHPGRTTLLRLPPGPNLLQTVLPRQQALPTG